MILGVLIDRPLTSDELQEQLGQATADGLGLDSSAWDPVHQWTDEELVAQRAEFADSPFASTEEDPATAAEVMVEEAELRRRRLADVDEAAASFDLAPVRTLGELVDLMVACRVLLVDEAGRYELNAVAPLPAEVLPLHPDAVAREDQLRWYRLHEPTAQAVIRLFKPNDGLRRTQLQASLRQLAAQVDADVESVRAGVTNLLNDGDFTIDVDVSTVGHDQPFELTVDWERFARTRFSVSRGTPPDDGTTPSDQE